MWLFINNAHACKKCARIAVRRNSRVWGEFLLFLEQDLSVVRTSYSVFIRVGVALKRICFLVTDVSTTWAEVILRVKLRDVSDEDLTIIVWQQLFTWQWRWLLHVLSKRQSPVLFRATLTWTITIYELLILLSSNHYWRTCLIMTSKLIQNVLSTRK